MAEELRTVKRQLAEAQDKALEEAAGAAYAWLTSTDPDIQQKRLDAAVDYFETNIDRPAEQVRDCILALKGDAK